MARTFETQPFDIEPLDVEFDFLAIDWDIDYVVARDQLRLIHDVACEEDFGDARWHTYEDYDFSFKPLGIPDPRDLHEFVVRVMRTRGHELPIDPEFAGAVDLIDQAAEEAGKLAVHNALSARSTRLTGVTTTHIEGQLPGVLNNYKLTGNVDPIPPEFPKSHHHARTVDDLVALGLEAARAVVDDSMSTADICVNEAKSNMGIVFGDEKWNRGDLPVLRPGLNPQQHRIVRASNHPAVARQIIGGFFPNTDIARRLLAG
jgi:hypothetical protein